MATGAHYASPPRPNTKRRRPQPQAGHVTTSVATPKRPVPPVNRPTIDWAAVSSLADCLRAGELQPWEVGAPMRRRAFELLAVEELKARGEEGGREKWLREAALGQDGDNEGNTLSLPPTPARESGSSRPSLTWSHPDLNLTFSSVASSASTIQERTFTFHPITYTLSPCDSPSTAPHLISLIAASPCLTDHTSLDITLDEVYPGAGGAAGQSDVYRGVLRCAGGWDERRVVVKLTCPTAHGDRFALAHEDEPEYGETRARLGAMEEAGMYAQDLAALQQTTVPVYYGTWVMRRRLGGYTGEGETEKEKEIVAVVLEDVGETFVEPWAPVKEMAVSERMRILEHVARLHAHDVLYKLPPKFDTSRLRAGSDGQGRIVGFSRSSYSPWGCTLGLCAVRMNLGLPESAEGQAREKVASEVEGLREYLELKEAVDQTTQT